MKDNTNDGLRFKSAESENFMGTDNTTIHLDGRSLIVSGKNEVGKSRLFQLLLSGIDTKNQVTEVISKGEEKAYTKVIIAGELGGQPEEYTIEMFFTPKNKSGRLAVTDKDQKKVSSPGAILKSVIGNISFDIFKFLNDTKANKIKILKELSGVRVDIDKNELARKTIFDKRTALNTIVERDETLMENHGLTPEEIDLYSEPKNIAPIQKELDEISPKITNWNRIKNGTADFKKQELQTIPAKIADKKTKVQDDADEIKKLQEKIDKLKENIRLTNDEISELYVQKDEARTKRKQGLQWLRKNKEPNAQEISTRLSAANVHNTNHEKVKALAEKQKALLKDKRQAMEYTAEIEKLDAAKDKLIANSKLPIKGLTFTDEEVMYNGLPLEEGQINTATLYDVGFEISKALNPKLKVIFIKAASLFDEAHLKEVMTKARKQGYQVIAERVTNDNKLELKFIETTED